MSAMYCCSNCHSPLPAVAWMPLPFCPICEERLELVKMDKELSTSGIRNKHDTALIKLMYERIAELESCLRMFENAEYQYEHCSCDEPFAIESALICHKCWKKFLHAQSLRANLMREEKCYTKGSV